MTDTPTFTGRARRVTLFEDRAEVVRRAEVKLTKGVQWVAVTGVTPYVDDKSLQARIFSEAEGVRVLSARVIRRIVTPESSGESAIESLEEARRGAERAQRDARSTTDRAQSRAEHMASLTAAWLEGVSRVPPVATDPDPWEASWTQISDAAQAASRLGIESQHQLQDSNEALALEERRLAEARIAVPRCEAVVEVQIEADATHTLWLEVTYRTPCALWRPEHLARLVTTEPGTDPARVEIVTWATAWQITGEDWRDVEVCFSTARPASAASAPLLEDDLLTSRRKTDHERKTIYVESREQAINTAALARDSISQVQEMPGVDDGGEPVIYSPEAQVTLASRGEPLSVEVSRVSLDAHLSRVLIPELSPVAHQKASLTLQGDRPLLAGPLRVARGASLVGRSRMSFVAPGEAFEIGFGADDAIRSRRAQTQEHERVPVVGTQKISREVKLYISNLSGQARALTVTERIPVSEIEAVEIHLAESKGWQHEAKDGFLNATVQLKPNDTLQLAFSYEIKAGSDVVMPF